MENYLIIDFWRRLVILLYIKVIYVVGIKQASSVIVITWGNNTVLLDEL